MSKDKEAAIVAKFLDELGKFVPADERVVFAVPPEMSGQPGESPETARERNFTFKSVPYKPGKYVTLDNNLFAAISSFKSSVDARGKTKWSRSASSFGRGLALMVDDIGSAAGSGIGAKGTLTLEHFASILPPTAIICTSPGNHQLWYFLSTPEPNKDRFKAFLESFVENVLGDVGGDRTIKDISRFGRPPGGINNKRTETGELKYPKDFRVRALYADYANRYDIDTIAAAFKFNVVESVRVARDEDSESDEAQRSKTHRSRERAADKRALELAVLFYERAGMDIGLNTAGGYRIKCPWGSIDHPHRNGDDAHIRGPGREYDVDFIFKCAHDTCIKKSRKWDTFVDLVVLPRIEDALEKANADARNHPYKDEP